MDLTPSTLFCGPVYDELCGGWLFLPSDNETIDALRTLFTRSKEPLTTAILSPLAMTPDGGPFFARAETGLLARALMEKAPNTVMMATAHRLHATSQSLPRDKPWNPAINGEWRIAGKHATLIVSAVKGIENIGQMVREFRSRDMAVHWQDPTNGKWNVAD